MSQELIDHNTDLKRLRDEGYTIETKNGYVLVRDIPYINASRQCCLGTLVCPLNLSGNRTIKPETHVMHFIGEQPCNADGSVITSITHSDVQTDFGNGIVANRSFSNKPSNGYDNYYEKFMSYINIIFSPVHCIDPKATPQVYKPIAYDDDQSIFKYVDTNTSRANIGSMAEKLQQQKIGIVGLGGTGAYILDQIAKTPVAEIHLYDGDKFYTHNAFRAPGAASIQDLTSSQYKTDYYTSVYSKMRYGITSHPVYLRENSIGLLLTMSFVFLSMDSGSDKQYIISKLREASIPFIDTGIGLNIQQNGIGGSARVTAVFEDTSSTWEKRISYTESRDDLYSSNIQIAEMNNLCAVLAVIKWKQYCGFYVDQDRHDFLNFDIGAGDMVNANE